MHLSAILAGMIATRISFLNRKEVSRSDMRRVLTEESFESSFDCRYKCHLLFNGQRGAKSEYQEHVERLDGMYQREALARLQEVNQNKPPLYLNKITQSIVHNSAYLVVIKRLEANGLRSDSTVLLRSRNEGRFQPLFFHRYDNVDIRAKLLLAFRSVLVERAIGITPSHGQIIYGRDFSSMAVRLPNFIAKAERRIDELVTQQEPKLFLCSHCEICEFQARCKSRALKEDSISLIRGMGLKQIEEQNKKGIFTLHQYSHTFRARKLPKRVKKPSKPRYFALQARALRDNKVYIYGNPDFPASPASPRRRPPVTQWIAIFTRGSTAPVMIAACAVVARLSTYFSVLEDTRYYREI
jgi:predicted RecB family nuclease